MLKEIQTARLSEQRKGRAFQREGPINGRDASSFDQVTMVLTRGTKEPASLKSEVVDVILLQIRGNECDPYDIFGETSSLDLRARTRILHWIGVESGIQCN